MNWALELSRCYRPKVDQANIYGVILYTNRHAYVRKVLEDDTFWSSLDEISGCRWTIFACRAAPGHYHVDPPPPGTLAMLRSVWKEPKANADLIEAFEIPNTRTLPALVVFAEADDGGVRRKVLRIQDSSQDAAYASLKRLLQEIADGLDAIAPEHLRQDTRAFDTIVNYRLSSLEEWDRLKKGLRFLHWIRSLR